MHKGLTKDFKFYIDGFNKQPGHYTDDELIQIGVAHQQLFRGDKDWIALAEYLGLDKTGEQFRKWILHARYKQNLVPKNPKVLDDKTVEDVIAEDVDKSLLQQKQDLVKEKMRLRDERTSLNAKLRDEARFESLKEVLEESIKILPSIVDTYRKPVTAYDGNDANAEGILLLSDWHIGQDCDNFYNKFNLDVAKTRIDTIINKTIGYCKSHNIKKLNVLNLGDLIEGVINNKGRIESNEVALKQLSVAAEYLAQALVTLSEAIPEVTYRSVTDNHSNITSNYKDRIPAENLNLLITWYLNARLRDSSIKFINDNLDIGLGRFSLDNGMKVAFFHGHEDPKDKTLQNLVGATHEWTDIVCAGHWHNPAEHVYQNMRFFINGSLCGTGPYALGQRLFTKPSQKLIIVENSDFLNIDISAE